jgi:hypothetical protein
VEEDIITCPIGISLFSAVGIVIERDLITQFDEKCFSRWRHR